MGFNHEYGFQWVLMEGLPSTVINQEGFFMVELRPGFHGGLISNKSKMYGEWNMNKRDSMQDLTINNRDDWTICSPSRKKIMRFHGELITKHKIWSMDWFGQWIGFLILNRIIMDNRVLWFQFNFPIIQFCEFWGSCIWGGSWHFSPGNPPEMIWGIYREHVYFLEAHFEAEYIDGKMRMYISYREPTGNL